MHQLETFCTKFWVVYTLCSERLEILLLCILYSHCSRALLYSDLFSITFWLASNNKRIKRNEKLPAYRRCTHTQSFFLVVYISALCIQEEQQWIYTVCNISSCRKDCLCSTHTKSCNSCYMMGKKQEQQQKKNRWAMTRRININKATLYAGYTYSRIV